MAGAAVSPVPAKLPWMFGSATAGFRYARRSQNCPPMLPDFSPAAWAALTVGAVFTGMAKTGLPGLGILVVVLIAHIVGDVRQSAAMQLPLLCLADLFGVWWFRRHAQVGRLWELAPWVLVGLVIGAATLLLHTTWLKPMLGVIVLAMIALTMLRRWRGDPQPGPRWSAGMGALTGFSTTVANAAGPVMNLYLLARRLPKSEFLATGAWFFLVINLAKIPVYAAQPVLGGDPMFTSQGLLADLILAPMVVVGALIGRQVSNALPQAWFDGSVLALSAIGAASLLWW